MTTGKKLKCFVIMPFSETSKVHTEEHWNNHFTRFLKPLIESGGVFEVERSKALHGDLLRQIVTDLVTAPLVVADLTDANPNVYWELGVRQSFKHRTITIAENGTKLPFDLTTKGTLFYYPNDYLKTGEFSESFLSAIKDCLDNPDSPDSYVLETLSGRGTLYQILMRDESLRRLNALISEIQGNEDSWKHIIATCKSNIQIREGSGKGERLYPTNILRHCCVDLLISTRYLSANLDFYEKAEKYVDDLMRVNERLPHWPTRESTIEEWLDTRASRMSKTISGFKTLVEQQKEMIGVIQ